MFLRVRADAEMNSREEGVDAIVMPDVTESLLWIFVWVTDDVGVLQNDLIMRWSRVNGIEDFLRGTVAFYLYGASSLAMTLMPRCVAI